MSPNTLHTLMIAEGQSFLVSRSPKVRVEELVERAADAARADGVIVSFDTPLATFPNTRYNIAYEEQDGEYHIIFAGHPTRQNALRYLFFLTHGWGHYVQHSSDEDPLLEAAISRASRIEYSCGCHLTKPSPSDPTMMLGSAMTGYEFQATALGWKLTCATLEKMGWSPQDYACLFWMYSLVDHIWHRRCITDERLPGEKEHEQWLRYESVGLDSLLVPSRFHYAKGLRPKAETLEMVLEWNLLMVGADGCLHTPDHITQSIFALWVERDVLPLIQ